MIAQASPISTMSGSSLPVKCLRPSGFECLRGMDLFSDWPDADLRKLAAASRERRVDREEIIIRQDESGGKHLFVLLTGEATVIWENGDGRESLLATLHPGDIAGEMELFDSGPRCATVRATASTRLLMLHRDDLLRGLLEKPEWILGFMTEIAKRLRQSNRRVAGICNQRTPRRLASILLSLLDERGVRLKDPEGRRCLLLRERPVQKHIAELAGTTRETVSRLFAQWETAGWMEDRNGDLMVYDEARLRRLAGEG